MWNGIQSDLIISDVAFMAQPDSPIMLIITTMTFQMRPRHRENAQYIMLEGKSSCFPRGSHVTLEEINRLSPLISISVRDIYCDHLSEAAPAHQSRRRSGCSLSAALCPPSLGDRQTRTGDFRTGLRRNGSLIGC